jgi:hypothetical protein
MAFLREVSRERGDVTGGRIGRFNDWTPPQPFHITTLFLFQTAVVLAFLSRSDFLRSSKAFLVVVEGWKPSTCHKRGYLRMLGIASESEERAISIRHIDSRILHGRRLFLLAFDFLLGRDGSSIIGLYRRSWAYLGKRGTRT